MIAGIGCVTIPAVVANHCRGLGHTYMTPTERKYKDNLGKLFIWSERIWVGHNEGGDGWTWFKHLVMPCSMDKRGGWWHYNIEVIKPNLDNEPGFPKRYTGVRDRVFPCADYARNSVPATPSLLSDTGKKEVA